MVSWLCAIQTLVRETGSKVVAGSLKLPIILVCHAFLGIAFHRHQLRGHTVAMEQGIPGVIEDSRHARLGIPLLDLGVDQYAFCRRRVHFLQGPRWDSGRLATRC